MVISDPTEPDRCRVCARAPCDRSARISRRGFLKGVAAATATVPLAGCDQVDVGWVARRIVPPEAEADLGARRSVRS